MMSRHVVSFFLVLLVAACNPRSSAIDTAWHDADGYRWRELDVPRGNLTPGFTSLPPSTTGISFSNMVSDSSLAHNRLLAQGAGVCLADVDGAGPPCHRLRVRGRRRRWRSGLGARRPRRAKRGVRE